MTRDFFTYLYPIVVSFTLQAFIYYGFAWKYSKNFSIGVLFLAYILALIVFISGEEFNGISNFMAIVIFTLMPSYILITVLSSIGKSIDKSLDNE